MRPQILLHPIIPEALHGLNPRTLLGTAWWDEQRQIAYAKEDYHCAACGVHKSDAKYHQWLEAHECYQIDYAAGTARMVEVVALCHSCHCYIHKGKMQMDLRGGRISREKYADIMEHGKRVLSAIADNSNPFVLNYQENVEWHKWRLILDGKEYYSKFKDYADWQRHYTQSS